MLFLPSLRLRRLADQWGGVAAKEDDRADFNSDRSAAGAEALALVTSFEERGLSVVFQAPTPIFHSPVVRCSDWLNARIRSARVVLQLRGVSLIVCAAQ